MSNYIKVILYKLMIALTLLHSEQPKLHKILAFLSATESKLFGTYHAKDTVRQGLFKLTPGHEV